MKTLVLLRFPFSLFLLPVSLFSLWFAQNPETWEVVLVFLVWHLLVYPASNGYNSYHDQDTGPIGGLANPPLPDKNLLYVVNAMDVGAVVLAGLVNFMFASFVLTYICFSRLYSHRAVRFKKFPILGYLVVIFFQGAWVFMANVLTFNPFIDFFDTSLWLGKGISASLIGTIYPITQIYQHEADRKDGVQTLSMLLGVKGTFVYCIALFVLVHVLMLVLAQHLNNLLLFQTFAVAMFPAALYFLNWFRLCIQNPAMANHTRTMQMLALSSVLVNLYFLGSLLFIL